MLRASSNTACHTCDGCDGDTTVWENERLALSHSCLALILESKTDMKRFRYVNRSLSVFGRPHDSCFRHISADDDGYCQPCRARGTHEISARQDAGGGVGRWEALPGFLYT